MKSIEEIKNESDTFEEFKQRWKTENKAPYAYNKTGTKMIVNTLYKEFNKQTNSIWSGNAITTTQYSNYIRVNESLDIHNYDLQFFHLNRHAQTLARSLYIIHKNFYLYEFKIYNRKTKELNVIGWLFMSEDNDKCYYSVVNGNNYYKKKQSVLDTCLEIINYEIKFSKDYKNFCEEVK